VSATQTSTPSASQVAASGFSYVARQPILTVGEKVFGYELLFRDGIENHFRETDADSASRRTLNTSLQMGLELLCDSRRGFVNCTREILLKDYMTLLPPTLAVVEVLESVPVDDLVVAALKRLKQAGYLVALDDFVVNDAREPLTEFADIIKVDIKQTTPEHYAAMMTSMDHGSATYWQKKWRPAKNLPLRKRLDSLIFRDIFSVVRRFFRPKRFPPAG